MVCLVGFVAPFPSRVTSSILASTFTESLKPVCRRGSFRALSLFSFSALAPCCCLPQAGYPDSVGIKSPETGKSTPLGLSSLSSDINLLDDLGQVHLRSLGFKFPYL